MHDRRMRFLRGGLTAGLSVVVAAFSHAAGGGAEPGLLGVILSMAFALPVCVGLAGRRVSMPRVAVSVVLSQLAFHVLFTLGSTEPAGAVASGGHHSPLIVSAASASGSAATGMAMGHAAMWLAHAVAAAVTLAGMAWGRRAVGAALRAAARRAVAAARVLETGGAVGAAPRLLPVVASPLRRPATLAFLAATPLRGPPRPV
ncbi:hypothetical protein ASF17_01405 [Frigoribacterium sp. Leaf263]|uniref:hypothetical protein n=1 Tax=Frigoribacterium sp. Leaf263 TaxID=1736313 RepID=UPI0007009EA7|nr:hypothetical protein [Frigoribacterium sp. Leaf263]KQO84220.1 hypothetical protein ASF17_01405 [Frigoribacterium sp. Leaf263]